MFLTQSWTEYEVLDTGGGEKLERWGKIVVRRPDPQTIWPPADASLWKQARAHYHRSDKGGGSWEFLSELPERWVIHHDDLSFYIRPTGFKHMGLFPEQASNWDWMRRVIREDGRENLRVLNLFGYTGGATLACMAAGAHVTHVDAAKGMVLWAKDNRALSNLPETGCRWIVEDVMRFIQREIRRGSRYDGLVMDPPSYGRGPSGEVWKLENELYPLISTAAQLLSEEPAFFLVNSYTTGFQASVLSNLLEKCVVSRHGGTVDSEELCLPVKTGGVLPCGASGRWARAGHPV